MVAAQDESNKKIELTTKLTTQYIHFLRKCERNRRAITKKQQINIKFSKQFYNFLSCWKIKIWESRLLVHFTNILRAAFLPISLCRKITNINWKCIKAKKPLLCEKAARKCSWNWHHLNTSDKEVLNCTRLVKFNENYRIVLP